MPDDPHEHDERPTPGDDSGILRRTIHYTGRVQGVGFRYTTEQVAARFDVAGFVQNLSDGRVRVVAEGETAELDRFQKSIADALKPNITSMQTDDGPATGEFEGFGITL